MRQLRRTVTLRTPDGNDHSEHYVIQQFDSLDDARQHYTDGELLCMVNRAIGDSIRATVRARLAYDLRSPNA